jgi:hypothetical protein
MKYPCRWSILCLRTVLGFLLVSGLARPVAAQYCWGGAASTATVPSEDQPFALQNSTLSLQSSAPVPFILDARDSVTGIYDFTLSQTPVHQTIAIRYMDNGTEARVRVFLRAHSITDGSNQDIFTFDSDSPGYLQSTSFQTRKFVTTSCLLENAFSFEEKIYFVRLELTKSGSGGTPAVHMVQVCLWPCP